MIFTLISCRPKDDCENCDGPNLAAPLGLAFSIPDGDFSFFSLRDDRVVWQTQLTGLIIVVAEMHPGSGELVMADGQENRLILTKIEGLEEEGSAIIGGSPVDVDISQSGDQLYAITRNGSFWAVSISSGEMDTLAVPVFPRRMELRPPHRGQAWVACPGGRNIHVIDLAHFSKIDSIPLSASPTDVAFSPNGETAYVGFEGSPGHITLFDAESRIEISSREIGSGPFDLSVSRDGQYLAAADSAEGTVDVWDLISDSLWTVSVDSRVMRVRFAADNTCYALCLSADRMFHIEFVEGTPSVTDTISLPPAVSDFVLWETVN